MVSSEQGQSDSRNEIAAVQGKVPRTINQSQRAKAEDQAARVAEMGGSAKLLARQRPETKAEAD
jgi:hypothetical protein